MTATTQHTTVTELLPQSNGHEAGEHVFSTQLTLLFVAAGGPTLMQAAREGGSERYPLTRQRISDWRNGKHLPRNFEAVEKLLRWLIERAEAQPEADQHALLSLAQWRELLAAEDLADSQSLPEITTPYRGLSAFTSADRAVYFGRDDLVHELGDAVLNALAGDGPRLVLVTGESGAGKSSLLDAGLARDTRLPQVQHLTVQAGVRPVLEVDEGEILVIDQFENVFSMPDQVSETVSELVDLVTKARGAAVLGIRSDFLKHCIQVPALAQALRSNTIVVAEMTDEQLKEAITGPIRHVGGKIDADLTAMMIADINSAAPEGGRAGLLPLLAHVLHATWAARTAGNKMTLKSYLSTGGVAQTVATAGEKVWNELDTGDRHLARAIILSMTYLSPGGVPLRVPISRDLIDARPDYLRVLNAFAAARLVTITEDQATLVHDIVLKAWPRLDRWLADDREEKLVRQRVVTDTNEWLAAGQDPALLYRGARLDQAVACLKSSPQIETPAAAKRFLDASKRSRRRGRRTKLIGIGLVAVLAVASTVAASLAIVQNRDLQQQRNDATYSSLLARISSLNKTDPSLAAQLLLVANRIRPDDQGVASQILDTQNTPFAKTLAGHDSDVYDVSFNRDGSLMGSASKDRTARIWKRTPDGFAPVGQLTGYGNYVTSVTFSPDSRFAATGSGDGTVRIWDITTPEQPRQVASEQPGKGTVYVVRFSPDGRQLAAPSDNGTVTVYDVTTPDKPRTIGVLADHTGAVRTVAFSPDGRRLATGSDDKTVRLWDVAQSPGPAGPPLTGFPSIAHSVAFSPDGRSLAVTGDGSNAQVWDVADPMRPTVVSSSLPGVSAGSWSIAYSPSGNLLSSALSDGTVKVWSQVPGRSPVSQWTLLDQTETAAVRTFSNAFSPDGRWIASGRADGRINLWQLPNSTTYADHGDFTSFVAHRKGIVATVGHDATLNIFTGPMDALSLRSRTPVERRVNDYPALAISADSNQVVTANNNGELVQVWDINNPDSPRLASTIPLRTRYTFPVDYSPTGLTLVTGSDDRSLQLWDMSNPAAPRPIGKPLVGPADLVRSAAFSPDGKRLAVTSDDGKTYVYDVSAPNADPSPAPIVISGTAGAQQARWTSGSRTLLVAGTDLTSWDVGSTTAQERGRIPQQTAKTMRVAPDDKTVTVGTYSRVIRTFALNADGALRPLPELLPSTSRQTGAVHTEFVSPDRLLVTGDSSGSLYTRSLSVEAGKQWVCSASDPITPDQWKAYVPDRSYASPC